MTVLGGTFVGAAGRTTTFVGPAGTLVTMATTGWADLGKAGNAAGGAPVEGTGLGLGAITRTAPVEMPGRFVRTGARVEGVPMTRGGRTMGGGLVEGAGKTVVGVVAAEGGEAGALPAASGEVLRGGGGGGTGGPCESD